MRLIKQIYGIDMEKEQYSKLVSDIPRVGYAISMGCNVTCPYIGRNFDDDWGLEDPTEKSDDKTVEIIREIALKILELRSCIEENDLHNDDIFPQEVAWREDRDSIVVNEAAVYGVFVEI